MAEKAKNFKNLEVSLIEAGLVNAAQIDEAKTRARDQHLRFIFPLIELGFVEDHVLANFLGEYLDLPVVSLHQSKYDQSALKIMPDNFISFHNNPLPWGLRPG